LIAGLTALAIFIVGYFNGDVVAFARERPSAFVFAIGSLIWLRFGVGWEFHQWMIDEPKIEGTIRQLSTFFYGTCGCRLLVRASMSWTRGQTVQENEVEEWSRLVAPTTRPVAGGKTR
jgi:hypothetical protein